jgi:ppGpp synthetase/RelA/SpoT-type nucleotidyltranferase
MEKIDRALRARFEAAGVYKLTEGLTARTWDDETRAYFKKIKIETVDSLTLYTSVHYVVETTTQKKFSCEIQVRTLAEELWGEVDHLLNYPKRSSSVACREQLAVLARMTSSCTRLVDSIFRSNEDHALHSGRPKENPK